MNSPRSIPLSLSEDQAILAKTASAFAAERLPLARVRKLREPTDGLGYSRETWTEMAKLGWTGIPFAEAHGGAGLGLAEVVLVTEALGRCLAPEPFVASVMLAGQALALAGNDGQRANALGPLMAGDKVVALAFHERGARYDVHRVDDARREDARRAYRIDGAKTHVAAGYKADAFVVVARTSGEPGDAGGITLLLVPADASGLTIAKQHLIDSRNAALVELRGVEVSESAVIGTVGGGAERPRRGHRSGDGGPVRRDARGDVGGVRSHPRVPEGPHAVRRRHRDVPGPEAPRGANVRRDRARAVRGDGGGARGRRAAYLMRARSSPPPRRAARTRTSSSPTRPSRCTAASG